jgi:hypothetical protein
VAIRRDPDVDRGPEGQRHGSAGAVGEHDVGAGGGAVLVDSDDIGGLERRGLGDRRADQRVDQGGFAGLEPSDDDDARR